MGRHRREERVSLRRARVAALLALATWALAAPVHAAGPLLHEPIPPDPREDLALAASADGDLLPAALRTPSGVVGAPDPRRPVSSKETTYAPEGPGTTVSGQRFVPDRDTRRPDVMPYDDPFTPSTAPFKRLVAFDAVDGNYNLVVRDERLHAMSVRADPATDGTEEQFFANLVVEVGPRRTVRVPSVGPGARIVHARLNVGGERVGFHVLRDGAENWFLEADKPARARLVMELTIPRATFGGDFGDPRWSDLPAPQPLPPRAAAAAAEVLGKLGLSRARSPRENVTHLVAWFRGFSDSAEPPNDRGDIYLDLALSRKGVCRHRAFAFLVTALALGIPTRMVMNEAHAWVEVHDGARYRRIDLGGAGRALRDPLGDGVPHEVPADPFAWPAGATRGEDLAARTRFAENGGAPGGAGPAPSPPPGGANGTPGAPPAPASGAAATRGSGGGAPGGGDALGARGTQGGAPGSARTAGDRPASERDDRPPATVTLSVGAAAPRRGAPLPVRGDVRADGEPCAHVAVEIALREPGGRRELFLGTLATDARGTYAGGLVVPRSVPLGDYDLVARTPGDARCGRGAGP